MKKGTWLSTSESVAAGHPDKVADQISDAILDEHLAHDPDARVACETMVTTGLVFVSGEITSTHDANVPRIARETIRDIGYTDHGLGFDADNCTVLTSIEPQSPDIDEGVSSGKGLHAEPGAGDQGMMCGFACRETEELMPMPIQLAHRLMQNLAELRTGGGLPYLRPDGKCQVTVQYEDGRPSRIHTVVVSSMHDRDVGYERVKEDLIEQLVIPTMPEGMCDGKTIYHVNPTGRFVVGGPKGDCGMTGRKIIVDTYGSRGSHGGGAFSGKDPTKVDRSAAYACRHAAKNAVAGGLADVCHLHVAYAIGIAEPLSLYVDTEATGRIPEEKIEELIREHFDFRPRAIIDRLDLRRPIYRKTARFGHFGREEPEFTWEKLDVADELREAAGL
jgi:S-adenosylmethionine synthetase